MSLPRVLLVEDFPIVLDTIELTLKRHGMTPDVAMNGSDAWDMIQYQEYALLIADLVLPGLNGIELIRRAREKSPEMRILAISGQDQRLLDEARAAGADYVLQKPFSVEEIFNTIEAVSAPLDEQV
ncbi:MAG: response regulator [Opitutales bacterium]